MKELYPRIYEIVRRIPEGKVSYYGQIALMIGNPRLARLVGRALREAPNDVPCHRVVNSRGETAPVFSEYGEDMQRVLLSEEGVCFLKDGRVDLKRFCWDGKS